MSGIEWDPTGRFVVTGVSSLKSKIDTGYYIWSFQGKILRRWVYCFVIIEVFVKCIVIMNKYGLNLNDKAYL